MQWTALAALAALAFLASGMSPISVVGETLRSLLGLRIRVLRGRRLAIVDGDTIRFRRSRLFGLLGHDIVKARLRGIDAPETGQPQGPASTQALRAILVNGGLHLAITCRRDVYDRELMWLFGIKGPVGLRMLWQGHAFATTPFGAPVALLARILRRGMWGKGRIEDPRKWRLANDHRLIR